MNLELLEHFHTHRYKQAYVEKKLRDNGFKFKTEVHCHSKYRVDFLIDMGDYVSILEIDEREHSSYNPGKEVQRQNDVIADISGVFKNKTNVTVKIQFIRFNPDPFLLFGYKTNPSLDERIEELIHTLRHRVPQERVEFYYLYYSSNHKLFMGDCPFVEGHYHSVMPTFTQCKKCIANKVNVNDTDNIQDRWGILDKFCEGVCKNIAVKRKHVDVPCTSCGCIFTIREKSSQRKIDLQHMNEHMVECKKLAEDYKRIVKQRLGDY